MKKKALPTDPAQVVTQRLSTAKKKQLFLDALANVLGVAVAAHTAGINRTTAYIWRKNDPDFATKWDEAQQSCIDRLEARHVESALQKDTLARIHLLKSHRREIYSDRVEIDRTDRHEMVLRIELPDHARLAAAAAEILAPSLARPVLEAELVEAKKSS